MLTRDTTQIKVLVHTRCGGVSLLTFLGAQLASRSAQLP
jgi:hypothetical protein